MRFLRIVLLFFFVATINSSMAQKRKNVAEKVKKESIKVEKTQSSTSDLLYENMLENTQRVFIIDSLVVDKVSFLEHIPLPKECGSVFRYDDFFNSQGHENNYVFLNEFENKAFFSQDNENGMTQIFTMDKLGDKWSAPQPVEGIGTENSPNHPFMMADGFTFYFAQKGEQSVGGYDIFVTRYDSDSGVFLRPNNIGLPFNSKSNDFFYCEDELDSLGWFVTDRNQPEGKVCIYTFEPSKNRTNYNLEDNSKEMIRSYAEIRHIKDTWPSEKIRETAMLRQKRMMQRSSNKNVKGVYDIIINDGLTYTTIEQFRSEEAQKTFLETCQAKERAKNDAAQLDALRDRYADSDESGKQELRPIIIDAERELEKLYERIKTAEKRVRMLENKAINK